MIAKSSPKKRVQSFWRTSWQGAMEDVRGRVGEVAWSALGLLGSC